MKQQNSKTEKKDFNKFLLTGCFLICIRAGWLIGSETTEAFSQSTGKNFSCNEVVVCLRLPLTEKYFLQLFSGNSR